jgi:predicted transcriptional regulator
MGIDGDMIKAEDAWRKAVLGLVAARPGASTRELATSLRLAESTVDYHLRKLKRDGALVCDPNGRSIAWFLAGHGLCPVLRRAVPMMRRSDARAVADALIPDLPTTSAALARSTGLPWGSARWTLQLLEDAGLVERLRTGRAVLAPGAETCRGKATRAERCGLWGACEVSKRWVKRREEERK